ncbi:MAG TPA: malto-oligosyltrehalose trehalohydrolase [Devosiaceae bacterium]|jgi:maltooligosyltrehalose trehalohydrolase|nr:malto-oligosyltrehalose trehalohydrolase [Devosiaceae bacterium]
MLYKASPPADFLPTQRFNEMKFGTQITATGVRFRLWAPQCESIGLKIEGEPAVRQMQPLPRGWFELTVDGAGPGTLYRFMLPNGLLVPDPASRFQPQDVLGPSEVVDPRRYAWQDVGWAGRAWEEAVFYELHLGTFTPEGTFAAAAQRLDYLVDLGITAIELMPVNDFPGRWNWGYDGALMFAPDSTYGRPEEFKALIDAAHGRGLTVMLDVVYNHFGPRGNFLPHYAPIFTEKYETPWGAAMNVDGPGSEMVRDFILANARYWLNEYHLDGLRLDAVHEIQDEGFNHLLHDLALQIRGSTDGRLVHLVVENEENNPEWLRRTGDLRPGLYDAQWNDDVHHLLDIAMYGEHSNYNTDYGTRLDWLPRALATGFGFQGEPVPTRKGKPKGGASAELPPVAFIDFIQNHDQVGNRLFGERVAELAPPERWRAAAAIYLLSPHIPMIFMGEEWATRRPFQFFSDVDPSFADDIRKQRAEAFGRFVPPAKQGRPFPDAMAEETFRASKLDWAELDEAEHREALAFYRAALEVRHREIVPRLVDVGGHAGRWDSYEPGAFHVEWTLAQNSRLHLEANLRSEPLARAARPAGREIWVEGKVGADGLGPWSVLWTIEEGA